ncbi:MAG: MBL fold metallo-hydrolase [Deltaproteobacteria bacterium]|nr:MBL fold metallo-hydrolase [Deltaproteobacteria bacterium]
MFGNAPRALWERWAPPDPLNRIDLACRTLLVREEGATPRWILFETGIGAFFEPKLRERFGVVEDRHVLLEGLAGVGISDADIDVVVLSHLHFDHAGGLLSAWKEGEPLRLLFPRARFVVGAEAWARATAPHVRDRASFIPELPGLLEASGRLERVAGAASATLGEAYRLHRSDGHTPGLLLSEIPGAGGPVVFAADLIPGRPWVRRALTMGYDRFPERLIEEKAALLDDLVARGGRLFFTHDPGCALARLAKDERGEVTAVEPVEQLDGIVA